MNPLYDKFLNYIRCELNLSAHTVLSYTSDLRQWSAFSESTFGEDFDPAATSASDLRMWVAHLSANGTGARSIRRKIQTLRAFFRYMMKRCDMHDNPALELVPARMPKVLPAVIRPVDMEKLLDAPYDSDDFVELRNHLILTMLYSTGMRASELTGLLDANVDITHGELKVLGKRNKERIIPFGKELADMIALYRTIRPVTAAPELFVLPDGRPLAYRNLLGIVKENLAGRVTTARRTPHVLRHSFATDMLNDGADITAVQQLLGHASLATTQIYTHLSYRELQHNYQLAHPRAQKKG